MSSGNIHLKVINSGIDQVTIDNLFDDVFAAQTIKVRHKAAQFLNSIRKKRFAIRKHSENKGYFEGYHKGSKEGLKAFYSTSRQVRQFRKHLEQVALTTMIQILEEILPNEKTVNNQIAQKMLREIRPRIKHLKLLKIVIHPKSEISDCIKNEFGVFGYDTEFDQSMSRDQLKLVTSTGEITLCCRPAIRKFLSKLSKIKAYEPFA